MVASAGGNGLIDGGGGKPGDWGKPDERRPGAPDAGGGGGGRDTWRFDGGDEFGCVPCGAASPRRVTLPLETALTGGAAASAGIGSPIFVAWFASSSKMVVDSLVSSKMCVASSSSSQSMSTAGLALAFAGRARDADGGGGMLDVRPLGGATTGGSEPRPGGGGGKRDVGVGIGMAVGAVTPRSVRLPSMGIARPAAGGGGGGTLRAPLGGGTVGAFFPRSSKMSRSDPLFSFCAMARVSCMCRPTEVTTETEVVSWSLRPM